jgi:putative transposase
MRDPQVILRQKIKDYAQTCVRYGYQRIHILFEREGIHVNHKRVYRLYRIENLHLRKKSTRKRVPRPLTLIDIYTRECLALHIAQSIKAEDVVNVPNRAWYERGKPESIRVDNGYEFISKARLQV